MRLGIPIDVQRFLKQRPEQPDGRVAREMRQTAMVILDKKLRSISAPPAFGMVSQIIEDPDLWEFLEKTASIQQKPIEELAKKVRDLNINDFVVHFIQAIFIHIQC